MLVELRIRNFAVIEEAALSFGPGLNVLSGETGAGKTIIMTALSLLLGGRASPDLIRSGAKEAVVEGIFELEGEVPVTEAAEWLSADNPREILIRRVITDSGRSRILVNDNSVTLQSLTRLGAALVQIYGQHEQQTLLQRENHQQILDRHGELDGALAGYRSRFESAQELAAQVADLERRETERAELLELARFRVAELEGANITVGEDAELALARNVLANAKKIAEASNAAEEMLYDGENAAIDTISQAHARLAEIAPLDPRLTEPLEMITAAQANLEEAARTLRVYAARIEADPQKLDQIDERLQELIRLKRKYGGTLEAALETLQRSREEIAGLELVAESRAEAAARLNQTLDELLQKAQQLSRQRARSSIELKRRMEVELKTLGMANASFEPRLGKIAPSESTFQHRGGQLGPSGFDTVEFYLAPNLGQPPMPLARIASGGELSRVMLALKRLEAQRRGVATLIFDEVDAGIGGAVAEIVGRKLRQLSRFHQILCVTHLAQIAAFGTSHFVVEKQERRGLTRSRVNAIKLEDRPGELARMLGGDESNVKFVRAARELMDRARD